MAPKTPTVDLTLVTKNLRALHGALEHSLTIQRTRLQEIVDDLVSRGSLSRADADGLVGQLLASSKDYSQALLKVLDSVGDQTRRTIGTGIEPVMATASRIADTVRKAPALATKATGRSPRKTPPATPKATAPKATTKPKSAPTTAAAEPVPNEPIADYSSLTVSQIKAKLTGLKAADLRRLRDIEMAGKARKTVLEELSRRIGPQR